MKPYCVSCETISFARNALTLLFQAVGLKSRKAGEGGEAGYGIPDGGYEDSEVVMRKVRHFHNCVGTPGRMQIEPPVASQRSLLASKFNCYTVVNERLVAHLLIVAIYSHHA